MLDLAVGRWYNQIVSGGKICVGEKIMPGVLLLCIFVIIPIVLYVVFLVYYFICKGKKIKITVLKKRKIVYDALNQVTYSNGTSTHYTIDCNYGNSAKIHTLGCEYSIFEQLKKNKTYTVTVKVGEIKKIHKKA